MKKYIIIINALEIMAGLLRGEKFEGVLFLDKETHFPTFKPWNRKAPKHRKDVLVAKTPWGWVKQSMMRKKRYSSIPSDLSLEEKLAILDEENELAKKALIEQELDLIEFC